MGFVVVDCSGDGFIGRCDLIVIVGVEVEVEEVVVFAVTGFMSA